MRKGISIEVSAADRARLEAVVADRNRLQKHVWRAKIILATADRLGTGEIVRRTGKSKPCVWRWQERFMREGVPGVLCDKTRPARLPPAPGASHDRPRDRADGLRAARGGPLDRARHGRGVRDQRQLGAAGLARAPSAARPGADLQARQRPGVRHQAARHRRPLPRPATACGRPVRRREVPDPAGAAGAGSIPARADARRHRRGPRPHPTWAAGGRKRRFRRAGAQR